MPEETPCTESDLSKLKDSMFDNFSFINESAKTASVSTNFDQSLERKNSWEDSQAPQ